MLPRRFCNFKGQEYDIRSWISSSNNLFSNSSREVTLMGQDVCCQPQVIRPDGCLFGVTEALL